MSCRLGQASQLRMATQTLKWVPDKYNRLLILLTQYGQHTVA
jgi:hypothetical protein